MAMPVVRYVPTKVPCESSVIKDIEEGIDGALEAIITAMTKPLTAEEKSPKPRVPETPPRLIFKGDLGEVNQFFYRRGWTDGLPIIPPTEEAVKEMLTGTDLPPDKLLGKLQSRGGKATIEKIAINAVMAGCSADLSAGINRRRDRPAGIGAGFPGLYHFRIQHGLVGAFLDYQRADPQ